MSWGTGFIHETYFNKSTFNSLYEVENKIEELERLKDLYTDSLKSLSLMTEPRKMLDIEDGMNPADVILTQFNESLDELLSIQVELSDLYSLRSEWNQCHTEVDGKIVAKNPPEELNPPYLYGDFIDGDLDGKSE